MNRKLKFVASNLVDQNDLIAVSKEVTLKNYKKYFQLRMWSFIYLFFWLFILIPTISILIILLKIQYDNYYFWLRINRIILPLLLFFIEFLRSKLFKYCENYLLFVNLYLYQNNLLIKSVEPILSYIEYQNIGLSNISWEKHKVFFKSIKRINMFNRLFFLLRVVFPIAAVVIINQY